MLALIIYLALRLHIFFRLCQMLSLRNGLSYSSRLFWIHAGFKDISGPYMNSEKNATNRRTFSSKTKLCYLHLHNIVVDFLFIVCSLDYCFVEKMDNRFSFFPKNEWPENWLWYVLEVDFALCIVALLLDCDMRKIFLVACFFFVRLSCFFLLVYITDNPFESFLEQRTSWLLIVVLFVER